MTIQDVIVVSVMVMAILIGISLVSWLVMVAERDEWLAHWRRVWDASNA